MQLRFPLLKKSTAIMAIALGSIAFTACSDDVGFVAENADPRLDPTEVNFGNVQLGQRLERTVFIQNKGVGSLTIESVSRGPRFEEGLDFFYDDSSSVIGPEGQRPITISFEPNELGPRAGSIVVRTDARDEDGEKIVLELPIQAVGVTSAVVVDPSVISFGNVVVDSTKTIEVGLRNDSDVDATVTFLSQEANNVRLCSDRDDPDTFCIQLRDRQIRPDNTFDLRAGESTALEVQFRPVLAGARERGSFVFRGCNNDACDIPVRLDGFGVESGFRCTPSELDFGQVNPGSCSTRTVSCQNIANEQVTVVSWGASDSTSDDYTFEPPRVVVVNENDSVDVDVTYCPNSLGEDEGALVIETDSQSTRTISVPLAGTGGGPDIEVIPEVVNFGLGTLIAPSRRTLLVTNVGFAPLRISEIVADSLATGAFTYTLPPDVNLGDALEPGQDLELTIEFQAQSEGPIESTLLIRSNDADEAEKAVRLVGEGINLPPCQFEIAPANLSFGVVPLTGTLQRAFEIRNTGANDCLVTSARIEPGSDPEFTLPDGDLQSEFIPPNSALGISVEFGPSAAATFTGAVEFSISSPTTPFNRVPLSGTGAAQTLLIVPPELNFGVIGVGCAARSRSVQIYNTGSTPATINSVTLVQPGNAYSLQRAPSLPASVSGGQTVEFDVGFRADDISDYTGAVEIQTTFGGQPQTYIVSLRGRGDLDATQIDEFSQLGTPKVDILFSIDHSCSMIDEQNAIASNFQAFIQFAQAQAIDYQLGVTTTDTDDEAGRLCPTGGPPQNRIVTPNTRPDPETVFADNVTCRQVSGGSSIDESGFEAAFLALSAPVIFGHNAGFLRRDAVLSIIFVSDEREQSSRSIDFYLNFFLSIKGFRNTNLFSASSISGPENTSCSGPGGSASNAPRYVSIANRTGGVWQEICSADWSRTLEELSTTAFGFKSRFFLTNQPIINTIEIVVDGVIVPATGQGGTVNWTYDFATNSINFSPFATPEPGAQIQVQYTAECL